ncbi:MAG TPA: triose-phosphate isomerase [Acidimicrobiia bacterium]|nr:triose-phosphate isomerase [Acidimicrobiia bacterium]
MDTMRKDLIAGNWKMNANHLEAIQMVQKLSYRLDPSDYERVEVVVCPPFTALRSVQTVIESDHLALGLGAQNVDYRDEGAFTGEISATMLAKLSVRYVIVGHSERRQIFSETDETVNAKARAVLAHSMTPILCVGETEDEREAGSAFDRVGSQVRAGLAGIPEEQVARMVVAYEPIWAIGTGRTASADDAGEMCSFVRDQVRSLAGDAADGIRVLYGGSVNPGNVAGLMAKRDIDGGLVGGASLDPDTFGSVIRYWI